MAYQNCFTTDKQCSYGGFIEQVGTQGWDYVKVNSENNWYKWNAAAEVHANLDNIADILNDRTFNGAGRWDDTLNFIDFKRITSIEYGDSAAFIQWSKFTAALDSAEYYMLINRRTWPGPEACQCPDSISDSQHVVYSMDFEGDYWVYDALSGDSSLLISEDGVVTDTVLLPPGEAVFLRFRRHFWKNSFSGLTAFPDGGIHYLSGDITIDSGSTFSIGSGCQFMALASCDSTSNGLDQQKVEIIVKGYLYVDGSSTDSIKFNTNSDSVNTWYGIRVEGNGSADIQYAKIENAYIGYKNTSSDTLSMDDFKNVEISDFYATGVYLSNKNMDVSGLTVEGDTSRVSQGMYLYDVNYDIVDCVIENVRYGIYVNQGYPKLEDIMIINGRRGIWVSTGGESDSTILVSCTLTSQSDVGILIGQNNTILSMSDCEITDINNYGFLNIYSNSVSNLYDNLFHRDDNDYAIYVYTNGGSTDLGHGIANSDGHNRFSYDREQTSHPPSLGYYLYNMGTGITYAQYCCWTTTSRDYAPTDISWKPYVYRCDTTVDTYRANTQFCAFYNPKAIESDDEIALPEEYKIYQNYPNPFNPNTIIKYALREDCAVNIQVYNILGQVVASLVDSYQEAGEYEVIWTGKDESNQPVATGTYFYQMRAGDFVSAKKMIVLK
jgi:hypothetical protein